MRLKKLRWWVIALIAIATIINYIDRQSLNVLWPAISAELYPEKTPDERKEVYAFISVVFVFSYAIGQALFGRIFDWLGTRMGFVLSIGLWSLATMAHAIARSVLAFSLVRAVLGVAEAGNWPGATKANSEWFPSHERALAQGIFNSGAAIGGIISIPLIAYLSIYFSWQWIFIFVGLLGLLWILPWWVLVKAPPQRHPWLTDDERQYILTGQKNTVVNQGLTQTPSIRELLSYKESWGIILASSAIDPIWWLFVFWIPIYLFEVYGMDVKTIGLYGWVPYVGAMFGAWASGLLAKNRLQHGWTINKTRKFVIGLGCLIMLPALVAMANPGEPVGAVLLMAVILFGFQLSINNIQTLPSDFFGGETVGSLAGIAGMAAKFTVAGLTSLIPWLTAGGNYTPAFVIGAMLAIVTLLSVLVLCPNIHPLSNKHDSGI
jgi:MFS transporter, ACS family, hexuronate transporter